MDFVAYTDFNKYTKQPRKCPFKRGKNGKKCVLKELHHFRFMQQHTKHFLTKRYCLPFFWLYKSIIDLHLSEASFFNLILPELWAMSPRRLWYLLCVADAITVDLFLFFSYICICIFHHLSV